MKTRLLRWGMVVLLPIFMLATARAQTNYTIDWFTFDGGGGTSTGAVYSVAGTIGQPDTGVMSRGDYTLQGGFWGLVAAVQTPDAPYLWLMRTTTNAVCAWWSLPDAGWKLHRTTNLAATGSTWVECTPYQTNATSLYWIEPLSAGKKFYRLHRP